MMTVLLIVHLIITICLVGMVLIQRSEGGGLGIGGGGGSGGFMTTRGSANAMTRTTDYLAAAFFATSIALSILAGTHRGGGVGGSVVDSLPSEDPLGITLPEPTEEPADDGLPEVPVGE